jgi:hypothetical protein
MGMTEQEKARILQERAKDFFNKVGLDEDENSLRDDITDVVETTIGKGSASEDIVKNLILLLENAGIEIE